MRLLPALLLAPAVAWADRPPRWPAGARLDASIQALPETESPHAPPRFRVVLRWPAAIDDVGIARYRVTRGGEPVAEVGAEILELEHIGPPGRYGVEAFDGEGMVTVPLSAQVAPPRGPAPASPPRPVSTIGDRVDGDGSVISAFGAGEGVGAGAAGFGLGPRGPQAVRGEPRPRQLQLTAGKIELSGPLPGPIATRVLRRQVSRLRACLADRPGADAGTFSVKLTAGADGGMRDLLLEDVPDDASDCVREALGDLRFPTMEADTRIVLPLIWHWR